MPDTIFISYRRDESEGEAARLLVDLRRAFGATSVLMDGSDYHSGHQFRASIESRVAGCSVLLAVIGPMWATLLDASGRRRIEATDDVVALAVAHALARNIPVVPVLVHDARMPQPGQLPDALKLLAYRHGIELSHSRWHSNMRQLVGALKRYVKPSDSAIRANAATDHESEFERGHAILAASRVVPGKGNTPSVASRNHTVVMGAMIAAMVIAGLLFALANKVPPHPLDLSQDRGLAPPYSFGTPPMPPDTLIQQTQHRSATSAQTRNSVRTETADTSPNPSTMEFGAKHDPVPGQAPSLISRGSPHQSAATKASNSGAALTGDWIDTQPQAYHSVDRLMIEQRGTGLTLHAFGWCPPANCDWGVQPAGVNSHTIQANFIPPVSKVGHNQSSKVSLKL